MVGEPSLGSWLRYNTLFLGLFALLGLGSMLVFEPVMTIADLLLLDGPPPASLFEQALPVTVISTLGMTALISRLYARSWAQAAAILLTCILLAVLLGLNISLMGLVAIPASSLYLLGETIGLIFALYLVYVVADECLDFITTYLSWRVGFFLEVVIILIVLLTIKLVKDVPCTGPGKWIWLGRCSPFLEWVASC